MKENRVLGMFRMGSEEEEGVGALPVQTPQMVARIGPAALPKLIVVVGFVLG